MDVLKKGILTEKQQKAVLEVGIYIVIWYSDCWKYIFIWKEEVRMKEQILRKHTQENESLGFRNQQVNIYATLYERWMNVDC